MYLQAPNGWNTIHITMETIHIEDLFGTRARIGVLRVLSRVTVPLSIRQVASQAGMSHAVVADALESLVGLGVVGTTDAGRSRVHWLERRNLIARDLVLPAFAAEEGLPESAVRQLRGALPAFVYSAVLFGSRARGDSDADSDFDVLVVERDRAALDAVLQQMDAQSADLRAALGARVSVLGYTVDEARGLVERGDNFMIGVVREGVLLLGVGPRGWGSEGEGA